MYTNDVLVISQSLFTNSARTALPFQPTKASSNSDGGVEFKATKNVALMWRGNPPCFACMEDKQENNDKIIYASLLANSLRFKTKNCFCEKSTRLKKHFKWRFDVEKWAEKREVELS